MFSRTPEKYSASFELLVSRFAALHLDPIPDSVLPPVQWRSSKSSDYYAEEAILAAEPKPSPELSGVLRNAPAELRKLWLPILWDDALPTESFLDMFRKLWVKFQLERGCDLTTRQNSIIKQVSKTEFGREERRQLMTRLGIGMLNAYVHSNSLEAVLELLRSLPALPLSGSMRGRIWAGLVSGLGRDELLREIHQSSKRLRLLTGTSDEHPWSESLLTLLEAWSDDALLRQLAENGPDQQHLLVYVCDWIASNLAFEEPNAGKAQPPTPPEPSTSAAVTTPHASPATAPDPAMAGSASCEVRQCDGVRDGWIQSISGACLLDLGPAFFDEVEVGRVGWQVEQARACGFDLLPHRRCFVGTKIVHDDPGQGHFKFYAKRKPDDQFQLCKFRYKHFAQCSPATISFSCEVRRRRQTWFQEKSCTSWYGPRQ